MRSDGGSLPTIGRGVAPSPSEEEAVGLRATGIMWFGALWPPGEEEACEEDTAPAAAAAAAEKELADIITRVLVTRSDGVWFVPISGERASPVVRSVMAGAGLG